MSPLSSIGDTACAAPPRGASPPRSRAGAGHRLCPCRSFAVLAAWKSGRMRPLYTPRLELWITRSRVTHNPTPPTATIAAFGGLLPPPLSLRDTLRSLSRVFCAPAVRYSLVRRFAPGVRSLSRVFLSCEGACRAVVLFRRSVPGEGRCTVLRRSRGWGRAGRSFPFLRSVGLFRSFSL